MAQTCGTCPAPKDPKHFHKSSSSPDGLAYQCKQCRKKYARQYRKKNLAKCRQACTDWRTKNREFFLSQHKAYRQAVKQEVFRHYSITGIPECACCGEKCIHFLTIDHRHGGGNKHRSTVGGGSRFYFWLKKTGFPDGYDILCFNCNGAKGMFGVCPHKDMPVDFPRDLRKRPERHVPSTVCLCGEVVHGGSLRRPKKYCSNKCKTEGIAKSVSVARRNE